LRPQDAIFGGQVFVLKKQFLIDQTGYVGQQADQLFCFMTRVHNSLHFQLFEFFDPTGTSWPLLVARWHPSGIETRSQRR
jgi:hypothetical protein